MADVHTAITAADLERIAGDERHELVRGELIRMPPVGFEHGDVTAALLAPLRAHAEHHRLGKVLVELGCVLGRDPDTVRAPDIAFVAAGRLPPDALRGAFFAGAPDLAVEVVSPHDAAAELDQKVQDYLGAGARLVLVVHPRTRTITAYRPDGTARILGSDNVLDLDEVVPGFSVPVADLFPTPRAG